MRVVVRLLPAVILVMISLWEICATRRDAGAVPGDDAWDRAAATVRAQYKPGDLIVFAPEWVDPVGHLHLGDLVSIDMAARMDAAKYARIWELSIRGARAPETRGLAAASDEDAGGVRVRRYEQTPAQVLADVRDRLPNATFEGGRASLELAEVGFQPHRCIEVVPLNQPVRVTFADVPLGTKLVGYVGIADVFTRRDSRQPGYLSVEIGGQRVADATAGVDDGWVRFEVATQPGTATVTFIARADAPQRQICFAAETRK